MLFTFDAFAHGVGTRAQEVAKIWAKSNILVQFSSLTGTRKNIHWEYMGTQLGEPKLGITFPDLKMHSTNSIDLTASRFTNSSGEYQLHERPLSHSTESNGQRIDTYFVPGIENPWGYSGENKPQTASHILWTLSGAPNGAHQDSQLGQAGPDPTGLMPIHTVIIDFERH